MPRRARRTSPESPRAAERIQFARNQRGTANEFAIAIWQMVRGGRVDRCKFRREYPEPPYTLDFVCLELRFVVEVDGNQHHTEEGRARDAERDRILSERGYRVLRLRGFDVLRDPLKVHRQIADAIQQRKVELESA